MKRFFPGILLIFFTCSVVFSQVASREEAFMILEERGEVIIEFERPEPSVLNALSRIISIDHVDALLVRAYANKTAFYSFLKYNIPFHVLDWPGKDVAPDRKSLIPVTSWQVYPTFQQYDSLMASFQADHPELCRIDTIGSSQEGRLLLAAKISDHVGIDEAEPEFFYTATIHGDETGGYVLMLRFIDFLLTQYGLDERVTRLVDNAEMWINPLSNPDGTYFGGDHTVTSARRYNANAVDLNRNFPNPLAGPHPDGQDYQPETLAMMDFMERRHFSLSANFHGGAEVANYPWDTWQTDSNEPYFHEAHPDNAWLQLISKEYADTAQFFGRPGYFTDPVPSGYVFGGDWYIVWGSRQDYVTYFIQGREVTMEIDKTKLTPENELDDLWNYNYRSLLNYTSQVLYGVQGLVTDADDHVKAVPASVTITGHDRDGSMVYADTTHGFYARLLHAGIYDLTFSAPGYLDQTVTDVEVVNYLTTHLNVQMVKNPSSAVGNPFDAPEVTLFPNPARDHVILKMYLKKEMVVCHRILDLNGRIIFSGNPEPVPAGIFESDIQVDFLESGIYILQISVNDRVLNRKLIKY